MNRQMIGILLVLVAGCSWGTMGACAQYLMQNCGWAPMDLVPLRLAAAGVIVLALDAVLHGVSPLACLKDRHNVRDLAVTTIALLAAQVTFLFAVFHTGAGTAAILLMLVPIEIALWTAFGEKKPLTRAELASIALSVVGVVLIITRGDFTSLQYSPAGIAWGIGSALFSAIYAVQPRQVLARIGTFQVSGWAMFAAGLMAMAYDQPWSHHLAWTWATALNYGYIVIVGTVVGFACYLGSLRYVSSVTAGIVVSSEPLSAYVSSVLFLGVTLGLVESAGIAMVIGAVALLSLAKKPA